MVALPCLNVVEFFHVSLLTNIFSTCKVPSYLKCFYPILTKSSSSIFRVLGREDGRHLTAPIDLSWPERLPSAAQGQSLSRFKCIESLWHVDFFDLKALEKQHMQEQLSDLPPKKGHKSSHEEGDLLVPGRDHSYHWKLGIGAEMYVYKEPTEIVLIFQYFSPIHFLVTVTQFTAPSLTPLSYHSPTICCYSFKKRLGLMASLGLPFAREGFHAGKSLTSNLYAFLLVTCLV